MTYFLFSEEYLQTFHELDVGVNNILVKPYEDLDETNVVDKFKQDSTDRKGDYYILYNKCN